MPPKAAASAAKLGPSHAKQLEQQRIRGAPVKGPGQLRRQGTLGSNKVAQASNAGGVEKQLSTILSNNYARIMDLMRDLDTNNDGVIDREEFVGGLRSAGFEASPAALYGIFDSIDEDGSGIIDFKELSKAIKSQRAFVIAQQEERKAAYEQINSHLRAKLGGLLVEGDLKELKAALQEAELNPAALEADLAMLEMEQFMAKQASTTIAAHYRGYRIRKRPPERSWRFATTHVCELKPGEECVFYVRENERLDLVQCDGSGRVVLDVTDARGASLLPSKSHVWDSTLQDLNRALALGAGPPPQSSVPIFSGPGSRRGQNYLFTVEESNAAPAQVKLKFSLEMLLLERNLVQEYNAHAPPKPAQAAPPLRQPRPPPPPRPQQPPLAAPAAFQPPPLRSSQRVEFKQQPVLARAEHGPSSGSGGLSARTSARAAEVEQTQRQNDESREEAAMSKLNARSKRQQRAAGTGGAGGGEAMAPDYYQQQWQHYQQQWQQQWPAPPPGNAVPGYAPGYAVPAAGGGAVGPPRVGAAPGRSPRRR